MSAQVPPPPALAQRWVRMMLAFGISVAVGLAPLLGYIRIPGFVALLELFPRFPFDLAPQLVAVTGLLMGVTALLVQYFQHEQISARKRKTWFIRLALLLALCLFALFALYVFNVEQIGGYNVLIGWSAPMCDACAGMARSECLARITLATQDIDRCFGSTAVRLAALLLGALYMLGLTALGALVGLLLLRQKS